MMRRPLGRASFGTIVTSCLGLDLTTEVTLGMRGLTHELLLRGESAVVGLRTGSTR